jgi:hypothetical protein
VGTGIKPLLWLSLGVIMVGGFYGAIGALIGTSLPQLSAARLGDSATGMPVRLLQSIVVFTILGVVYIVWGLMALGVLRNPFAQWSANHAWGRSLFMGATIGAFMIGRPYPLFFKMFQYAASTHDPIFGALSFILSGLGNIVIMAVIFLILHYGTRGRFQNWLTSNPSRVQLITAYALIIGGVFYFTYWGLRLPARFGIGWWPQMPWN